MVKQICDQMFLHDPLQALILKLFNCTITREHRKSNNKVYINVLFSYPYTIYPPVKSLVLGEPVNYILFFCIPECHEGKGYI